MLGKNIIGKEANHEHKMCHCPLPMLVYTINLDSKKDIWRLLIQLNLTLQLGTLWTVNAFSQSGGSQKFLKNPTWVCLCPIGTRVAQGGDSSSRWRQSCDRRGSWPTFDPRIPWPGSGKLSAWERSCSKVGLLRVPYRIGSDLKWRNKKWNYCKGTRLMAL